jgi:nitrous oxidase accessory protein
MRDGLNKWRRSSGLVRIVLALLSVEAAHSEDLAARIEAASPGDTIIVDGGVHRGNLHLSRKIALIGLDNPVLAGDGSGSVVTIDADSCTISGFIIRRSGSRLVEEDAGILVRSGHNLLERNRLDDILFGIYLLGADSNLVRDNDIRGRSELELGERGSGIHVWNSIRNRFVRNRIFDVRDGFYIQNANHSWIESCESGGVRYGVHYMYADSNVFVGNRFYENLAGAAIMYSRGIRMYRNEFTRNHGFSSFGILFQDCHGLVADSNLIAENGVGMFFEASTDNMFRNNIIARNTTALQMFQNSVGNTFSANAFIDNLSPLVIVGKRTESHWSLLGVGNYWSSYAGYDLEGDGIGDVPMKIQNVFQYIEGRNPSARLFLYSPASQALAAAADAFPIVDLNREIDPHPLMRFDRQSVSGPHGVQEAGSGTTWDAGIVVVAAAMFTGGFLFRRSRNLR